MFGLTPSQLLGHPTLHLPINFIIQNVSDGKVVGVFQTTAGNELLMGSTKTHQLMVADAFVRPQLVFESDEFQGYGISGLLKNAFLEHDKWIDGGMIFKR